MPISFPFTVDTITVLPSNRVELYSVVSFRAVISSVKKQSNSLIVKLLRPFLALILVSLFKYLTNPFD